jgi:hypothetical protein
VLAQIGSGCSDGVGWAFWDWDVPYGGTGFEDNIHQWRDVQTLNPRQIAKRPFCAACWHGRYYVVECDATT